MYKDELIQLHQFLVYVLKYLDTDNSAHEFFDDYLALKSNSIQRFIYFWYKELNIKIYIVKHKF